MNFRESRQFDRAGNAAGVRDHDSCLITDESWGATLAYVGAPVYREGPLEHDRGGGAGRVMRLKHRINESVTEVSW
jgi:hypothetical protein